MRKNGNREINTKKWSDGGVAEIYNGNGHVVAGCCIHMFIHK